MTTPEKKRYKTVKKKEDMKKEVKVVIRVVMQYPETFDEDNLRDETKTVVMARDMDITVQELLETIMMDPMVQRKIDASGRSLTLHAFAKGETMLFKRGKALAAGVAIKDLDGASSGHMTMVATPAGLEAVWLGDGEEEAEGYQSAEEGAEGTPPPAQNKEDPMPSTPQPPSPKRGRDPEEETPTTGLEGMHMDTDETPNTAVIPGKPESPTKLLKQ